MTGSTTVPLKAYRSALRSREAVAWTLAFWPVMALAVWLLGDPAGGETVLFEALLLVLPVLFVAGRPATLVLPEGIRVVPYLWRATTYPWADIEDIREEVRGHSRGGSPIYGVRMHLARGRRWLPSLGNHAQAIQELQVLRDRHGWATAVSAHDPTDPVPVGSRRLGHPVLRLVAGCVILAIGVLFAAAGISESVTQTRLQSSGIVTQATITDVQAKSCYKSSCRCPMTWIFTDRSGDLYAGSSDTCSSLYDGAELGVVIAVIYDPADPAVNQPDDRAPDPAGPAAAGALFAYVIMGVGVAAVLPPLRAGLTGRRGNAG